MARSFRPPPPRGPAPPWFPARSRPPRPFLHGASRKGPPRRRARRWLLRNRRLIVALLLCLAAGLAVQQLTPAPAATVSAWAAARDLPAGRVLAAVDLAVVQVPPGLLPGGTLEPLALEGKQLAVALRKGQLVADSLLVGPGMLAGSPPGAAAVPLRMADPASIQLVSPGQLINVVMTGGGGPEQGAPAQLLASAVPVLWTSARGGRTGQWLDTAETDGLMVVAADPDQARRLAGASTQGKLFFVLVGSAPG
ncbi:RcpC/CpaB family pilus assembly protein [Pseudarthrobacter sp. B907]|uniref:RcpC/CpaB family pilus assembly protein n=1 Tax=Pseudarthrobacter sp. B907 TaxID=3158261 RepID=UPI0032DB33D4